MELGIGLPNTTPGTRGDQLTDWARAAEEVGFSTLGTIDRIVYPNYEPLVALSAAAAVTDRIPLATTVMLGPLRMNAVLVAKQVLSIDALAGGGRFTLGIALGGREDDYEVSGISMSERASWLDSALPEILRIWNGEGELEAKIGPSAEGGGPSLILGGTADASFERAARHGDGWISPGGSPDDFSGYVEKLTAAWKKHGRDGEPRKLALGYFSLGDDAERNAEQYLNDYYAWLGEEVSGMIASRAAKDGETVKGYMSAFEDAGCDELILFPCSSEPEQVRLLAEAAGLSG
jgi:alkanesulfonate monooxygenase SsuD/methylene tetrahydromethanopterin reductase-like flavin-dependent oxidoreductase (luciferase family)